MINSNHPGIFDKSLLIYQDEKGNNNFAVVDKKNLKNEMYKILLNGNKRVDVALDSCRLVL